MNFQILISLALSALTIDAPKDGSEPLDPSVWAIIEGEACFSPLDCERLAREIGEE